MSKRGPKTVTLINPGGGSTGKEDEVKDRVAAALRAHGIESDVELLDGASLEERRRQKIPSLSCPVVAMRRNVRNFAGWCRKFRSQSLCQRPECVVSRFKSCRGSVVA